MPRFAASGITALATLALAGTAWAEDIGAKKIQIKDPGTPAKRQVQAQSSDPGVLYSEADAPGTRGASIHVYSATDDQCFVLPAGPKWADNGKSWKYVDPDTKNQAQIADGKLQVKLRSGVAIDLADDGTQGAVNVQVQFGDAGSRYCMRCSTPAKDDTAKFIAKDCAAAVCDTEASPCLPSATTTTSTTSTTTTMPPLPGVIVKAVLPKTNGNFNFMLMPGVAGADAACNTAFAGTHVCTGSELVAAEGAGDLDHLKDPSSAADVTSLWVIDSLAAADTQCPSAGALPWAYATAHFAEGGSFRNVENSTGVLDTVVEYPASGRNCANQRWLLCCQ